MKQSTHESFVRDEPPTPGSDRTFGLVMAAALAIFGLFNAWHHGRLWPWMLLVAALLLAASMLKPAWLHPLNRLWMMLGLVLHKIVNPIVMGLLFYGTILPTGLGETVNRHRQAQRGEARPHLGRIVCSSCLSHH